MERVRLRFCCFPRSQSVWPERCLLILDVRERQDTAKELATAHDTPEARESEQKPRSHTTVNVDQTRIYTIYTTLLERGQGGISHAKFLLQILLPRWETIAVVAGGGNRREDHRCFSNSSRSSCLSCPISRHYQGKNAYLSSCNSPRKEKEISRAIFFLV